MINIYIYSCIVCLFCLFLNCPEEHGVETWKCSSLTESEQLRRQNEVSVDLCSDRQAYQWGAVRHPPGILETGEQWGCLGDRHGMTGLCHCFASCLSFILVLLNLELLILIENWKNRLKKLALQETFPPTPRKRNEFRVMQCSCSKIVIDLKLLPGE